MSAAEAVNPDHILKDLAELWTSMGQPHSDQPEAPEAQQGSGVLRACAMTLIVFVDEEDDPQDIGQTLAELMRTHPSRALVVRVGQTDGDLQSRVFAQCWKPHGQALQICCEQVELSVSLNRLNDAASILAPVTAPDLPRVVWFRSSRLAAAADLSHLVALGDKIIVDSTRPGAPAFADLRTLMMAGCLVGDLAWTRITRLRELLAQLIGRRAPETLTRIELTHGGSAPGASAKYLQAWLRRAFPQAAVDFRSGAGPAEELSAIDVAPDLKIQIDHGCAKYEIGTRAQYAKISPGPEPRLLAEELNIIEHDRIFESTLERMTPWSPPFRIPAK